MLTLSAGCHQTRECLTTGCARGTVPDRRGATGSLPGIGRFGPEILLWLQHLPHRGHRLPVPCAGLTFAITHANSGCSSTVSR
jgi:hypothetical protein